MKKAFIELYSLLKKKEKIFLVFLFIMMLIASVLEIIGIGAIPAFLAVIINPDKLSIYPFVSNIAKFLNLNEQSNLIVWGSVLLILIFITKNLFIAALYYFKSRFLFNFKKRMEIGLYKKYIYAPFDFHLHVNSSDLIRNVTLEVTHIIVNFLLPTLQIILDIFLIALILIMLVFVNAEITLTVGVTLALTSLIFSTLIKKKLKKHGKIALDHRQLMIKHLNQGLGAIKEIKVIGREDYFVNKFSLSAKKTAEAGLFRQITSVLPKPFLEVIMVIGLLSIILILYTQGKHAEIIVPTIALYAVALVRLLPVIGNIITSYTSIRYNYVSVAPVYDHLMNIPSNIRNNSHASDKHEWTDYSCFVNNLSFKYPNSDKMVLNSVSFKINKGNLIGFVGYTGSGKTTLVDILLGLLASDEKSVHFNNESFNDLKDIFPNRVGYIPQNIFLLDDSIKNNIALGVDQNQIDTNKLNKAIEMSQLNDFINHLDEGIETIIGERGIRLSGGQRQRIGIARALYFEPEILIMDEATSSLDNQTERFFIEAIQNLRKKMTIIIIAHRLSTIEYCDHIYFIREGKVIAEGTYHELLADCSEFRNLAGELNKYNGR